MIVVVGGGVIGLAAGRALAAKGREVCVLERGPRPGQGASTHNSGVIHAGLYYPPGSLKATLCVEGRERLYAYCDERRVPFVRCGKLVVATSAAEEPALGALFANAAANGVALEEVSAADIRRREPHVRATRGLFSPSTGWIEVEAFIRALRGDLERLGGALVLNSRLVEARRDGDRWRLTTSLEEIEADLVVNAAGLYADDISRICGGDPFTIYPCRGEYAELAPGARGLINGLVYPVPHPSGHGLGVHLTRTLGGEVWIGPTIAYQSAKDDYESGREPLEAFVEPTARLLPGVTLEDLRLGGSGIRAKLHPPSERFADFLIGADSRQPALIHAAGIDSPGLTASLAIAERIAALA